jgi:hypothetical protein
MLVIFLVAARTEIFNHGQRLPEAKNRWRGINSPTPRHFTSEKKPRSKQPEFLFFCIFLAAVVMA